MWRLGEGSALAAIFQVQETSRLPWGWGQLDVAPVVCRVVTAAARSAIVPHLPGLSGRATGGLPRARGLAKCWLPTAVCLTVKSSGSNLPNSQIPGTVHCFCRPTFPQCWGRHPTELRGPVWGPAGSMRGRRVWASGEVVSGSFCALWGTHPLKAKASGPCSLASLARTSPHRRLLLVFLWPLFPKL